jgi:cytochrome c-type biogenesis protein CcmH
MLRSRFLILLAIVLIGSVLNSYVSAAEMVFANEQEQQAFQKLLKEFRCVTCSNQSIADSRAPVAEAMQAEIYRRFKRGDKEDDIKAFLQANYGDYVLYRPTLKKQNALLWLGPFFFLTIGFLGWFKWRR